VKIYNLAKELRLQETLLLSIEKTVRECHSQALTLAHIDDDMWDQIWKTLADCKITLDRLDGLIKLISPENANPEAMASSKTYKNPGRFIQFKIYRKEMSAFSDQVYKSNTAMQTALSVIHV
jgi:hypothetical protein